MAETTTSTPSCSLPPRVQEIINEFRKHPLYQPVSNILYWKDLVESGLAFAVVNFLFILLIFGDYSVLTLVSYLLLSFLVIAGAYVHYIQSKSKEPVENPLVAKLRGRDLSISEDLVNPRPAVLAVNYALEQLREAFLFTNNAHSLKVGLGLWVASIVGNLFSTTCLLYLCSLVASTWPRLYQEKQADIDRLAGIARAQADVYGKLAYEKLPPAIKKKLE